MAQMSLTITQSLTPSNAVRVRFASERGTRSRRSLRQVWESHSARPISAGFQVLEHQSEHALTIDPANASAVAAAGQSWFSILPTRSMKGEISGAAFILPTPCAALPYGCALSLR